MGPANAKKQRAPGIVQSTASPGILPHTPYTPLYDLIIYVGKIQ